MKIFLSALENQGCGKAEGNKPLAYALNEKRIPMKYILMSFYYIQKRPELAEFVRDHSELIMIDSGAHSFQKGAKVKWNEYVKSYADFIKWFDRPNVVGYFEMDVDGILGYENVLKARRALEEVSPKIIPVWHNTRGIAEYTNMCKLYSGKTVAISGFRGMDIKDHQYIMFVKEAWKYKCKIHCLGMTRKAILDKVPFDYTDSSSWVQESLYGRINGKGRVSRDFSRANHAVVLTENYKAGLKLQEHYHEKWKSVCHD